MRSTVAVFCVAVFLFPGRSVVASPGQAGGREGETRTRVALDLTDLDIPGKGGEDEMELPPIQGTDGRKPEGASAAPSEKPPEMDRGKNEMPTGSRSAPLSTPGLAPFLLDEPDAGGAKTRAGSEQVGDRGSEAPADELPAELKALPPPPSHAESLKLPPGTEGSASGRAGVPEIPLLDEGDRGQPVPGRPGQDGSLTMKPFPDLRGTSTAGRASRPSSRELRPEDTLQVHEDIDAKLIDLFERFYKDR